MNINFNKDKTFGDLDPANKDKVFVLDPNTGYIRETTIASKKNHFNNGKNAIIEIEIYRLTNIASVTEEKMEVAKEDFGTDIYWKFKVIQSYSIAMVTFGESNFTIISADEKALRLWMERTGPENVKNKFSTFQ